MDPTIARLMAQTENLLQGLLAARPLAGGAPPFAAPSPGAADIIDIVAREVPTARDDASGQRATDPGPTPRANAGAAVPGGAGEIFPRSREQVGAAWHVARHVARQAGDRGPRTGERVERQSFVHRFGTREYRLFVPATPPAGVTPQTRPLLLMLHGCTQDADDFAAGTRMDGMARRHGFAVLYPTQGTQASPQRCWNWFKKPHQQRDRGEPALLADLVREVLARENLDGQRIYVAGLSAGGAMAAVLGRTYPDLFAAVGVHSGLAAGAAHDLPSALAAMQRGAASAGGAIGRPLFVVHGDADATVHPSNAAHLFGEPGACGCGAITESIERVATPGGLPYTRHVRSDSAGRRVAERWVVHGGGHAWSGGSTAGSYTAPSGPDATTAMVDFLLEHRH